METIQERFNRLMDERHTAGLTAGLTAGRAEGLAAGRVEGQVEGLLVSFRRTLADSGLDHRLVTDVAAHADRIVEAARRGVRFDLDDIPDAARLMAAIRDGGGPTRVSAERIWALLPHNPGRGCGAGVAPVRHHLRTAIPTAGPSLQAAPALIDPRLPLGPGSINKTETVPQPTLL